MERPIHRYRRFKDWDYSRGASFFITLSLDERKPLFGQVHDGIVCLSELGREVLASLERIPVLEPAITLYGHVVMPDHVHFNCHLAARLEDPLEVLGRAIRSFKNHTTKFCKLLAEHGSAIIAPSSAHALQQPRSRPAQGVMTAEPSSAGEGSGGRGGPRLWRLGYHDHLCLSRRFIAATERYIAYNPLKWALMHGSGSLRIHEPLFSPRLDPAEYLIRRKSLPRARPRQRGNRLRPCRLPRRERRDRGNGQIRPRLRPVFHARGTGTAVATPPDTHTETPRGRADPAHEPGHGVLMAEHCSAREGSGAAEAPGLELPCALSRPRARIRVPQPFQPFNPFNLLPPLRRRSRHLGREAAT